MSWSDQDNHPSEDVLPGVFSIHQKTIQSHIIRAEGIVAIELVRLLEDHIVQMQQLRDNLVKSITDARSNSDIE